MKIRIILLLSICWFSQQTNAQSSNPEAQIKSTITQFFDAMQKVDSSAARKLFFQECTLKTVINKKDGSLSVLHESLGEVLNAIGSPRKEIWDERILSWDIRVDGPFASAWCDYAFYLDQKMLHCGIDAFQLANDGKNWRILEITDTRRKTGCEPQSNTVIDTLMDKWHRAAANADEDVFFGLMSADADYIGTDPTEHWKRDELKKWSEKYFQKDSAWDFKPLNRTVYFTENGQHAWFDELLDTWMGKCRGSGVLKKTSEGWKIKQYVLSMAVLNDLTKPYLELLKKQ